MGKFDKIKQAQQIITEASNISKCPCCNYHKQAIIQCAKIGHQQPKSDDEYGVQPLKE